MATVMRLPRAMRALVAGGADPNQRVQYGRSLLYHIVTKREILAREHQDIIKLLVELGADAQLKWDDTRYCQTGMFTNGLHAALCTVDAILHPPADVSDEPPPAKTKKYEEPEPVFTRESQRPVYEFIRGDQTESGPTFADIAFQTGDTSDGHVTTRNALTYLVSEGYVYTSIDEDHFKAL
jgi:hypothetical protein